MSLSSALDVAIGLMIVYYLLGSVVSLITQLINETLETRGKALEQRLLILLGDKKLGELIRLPQMQSLRPIRYKNIFSVFSASIEPKKLEKIPVAMLVDAVFDISGITAQKEQEALKLREAIEKLPDSESKDAFLGWFDQGISSVSELRTRASDYFKGVAEQAASIFRARARSFVIVLSMLVTLVFGTDSIQLAGALWSSAELRAIAVAQAPDVVATDGGQLPFEEIVRLLGQFSIRADWFFHQQLPESGASPWTWIAFVFMKILGLGITAMAVSQGASFWYDLLKKVTNPVTSTSSSKSSDGWSSSSSSSTSSSG